MTTLSDVTDAGGKSLCSYYKTGNKHPHRQLKYEWSNQNNIAMKHWKTWSKSLRATFTTDGTKLKNPLGNWDTTRPEAQEWKTYRGTYNNVMYMKSGLNAQWTQHKSLYKTQTTIIYENIKGPTLQPPKNGNTNISAI